MTIEVNGHVEALTHFSHGKVLVRILVESSRMVPGRLGEPPRVEFIALSDEVAEYKPGMAIKIQIRPCFANDASCKPMP
jgi:hypothetical protein